MAVFLINICKFNGCGIKFPSLGDLIQHIEDTHIDYDPHVIVQKEQDQPQHLPLSYVLPFITEAARKEPPFLGTTTSTVDLKRKLAIKHHSYSMSSSNRSTTPTGSEIDDEELMISEYEDSNDSWTTEEFSSEFIMRYGSRHSTSTNGLNSSNEKPFACPVPGCKKRYKNVNGIKYHSKNGHKKDGKIRKGYKCHCGKSYKTSQGLKNHSMCAHHNSSSSISNDASNSSTSTQLSLSHSPSTITSNSTIFSTNNTNSNPNCNNNTITSSLVTSPININAPNTPTTPTSIKNNLSLVTIKSKPSLVGLTSTNKLLKIISNDNINEQIKTLDSSKNPLPNLVAPSLSSTLQNNLLNNNSNKIENNNFPLTPVQSPKLPTQNQSTQPAQLQPHQQTVNKKNDNLPLTPISQNTSKTNNNNNNNIFDKNNDNIKIFTNSSET